MKGVVVKSPRKTMVTYSHWPLPSYNSLKK